MATSTKPQPRSRSSRASAESGYAYTSPTNGASPEPRPHTTTAPTPPEIRRYTAANLRRHLIRAVLRVTALLAVDLVVFASLRMLVQLARDAIGIVSLAHGAAIRFFPQGSIRTDRLALGLILGLVVTGAYGAGDRRTSLRRLFLASTIATSLEVWPAFWSEGFITALGRAILMVTLFSLALPVGRRVFDRILRRMSPRPRARALLIGARSDRGLVVDAATRLLPDDFEIVGTFETGNKGEHAASQRLSDLEHHLQSVGADTVVVCGSLDGEVFERVAHAAIAAECHFLTADQTLTHPGLQPEVVWLRGYPLIEWRKPALRAPQLILKRMLDLVLGGLFLVTLSPIMALVALLVKLGSRGPVLFTQTRLGKHGQLFDCHKFRSMYIDAEERLRRDPALYAEYVRNDFKLPAETDTRVTPVGRLLRALSLDELPQLWNVLRGDMSLVGPRPIVPDELRHYTDVSLLLLSLKPGLTGAWQVNGRSKVAYPARTFIELDYVRNWSIGRDVSILLRTVPAVVLRRGAH